MWKGIQEISIPKKNELIKRIWGNVIISKMSVDYSTKMVSKLREIFNDYIPDVWIYSDLIKNGWERFFGVSLYTNNFFGQDICFDYLDNNIQDPEIMAEICAKWLLDDIN